MSLFTSKKGFTLIELLIVIGILAVLAVITVPTIAGVIDKSRVSKDAETVRAMELGIETFSIDARSYLSVTYDIPRVETVFNIVSDGRTDYDVLANELLGGKLSEEYYPATPVAFLATVSQYCTLRDERITVPSEFGTSFYYNVDTGFIIKAKEGITDRETLKEILMNTRDEEDGTGRWIDLTASIKYDGTENSNEIAEENKVNK